MGLTDFSTGVQGGLQQLLARRVAEQQRAQALAQQQFQNERLLKGDQRDQQQIDASIEGNRFNRERQAALDKSMIEGRNAEIANKQFDNAKQGRETFTPGQFVDANAPTSPVPTWEKLGLTTGMAVPKIGPRLYTSQTDTSGLQGAAPEGKAGIITAPTNDQSLRERGVNAQETTAAASLYRAQHPGASSSGSLSPTSESQIINRLSTQWQAATKPARDLDRQVALMNTGLDAARRGDLAQGAQAVLVTFQKILDPTSVVRESEYMRSSAGQSLVNRIEGAAQRLSQGGAGVPLPELEKFAALAKAAADAQRGSYLDGTKRRIGATADHYRIPHELIFEDMPPVDAGTETQSPTTIPAAPAAAPQRVVYDANGKRVQ